MSVTLSGGVPGSSAAVAAEVAKTANYVLTASDAGTTFTNVGANTAVVFTLPAVTNAGFTATFHVEVEADVTVASAEGNNVVWTNNAGKSSLAFTTANQHIGGRLVFRANGAGTKWLVANESAPSLAITAA